LKIALNNAGKKYYREWIFRKTNISFSSGQKTVILGPNGSGKSTLLQIIAGSTMPNEGLVSYHDGEEEILPDEIYSHISFAAPYLELIEEFTLREIIHFHYKFKKPLDNFTEETILEKSGLTNKSDQVYRYFSSGMKQRVKLLLAILSKTPILLLDEPCSNLDSSGTEWYRQMMADYTGNRIVIIASNHNESEYSFCDSRLNMADFKT
jgi:ABC-type multidrug transport system ATPase subunit